MHFAKNYKDRNTIRLFGLKRFSIPNKIIESYPQDKIFYCEINKDGYKQAKILLVDILKNSQNNIKINFHLNVSSSLAMMKEMYDGYRHFLDKIVDIELHLYDDGSKDIINLYNLSKFSFQDINNLMQENYFKMNHLFFEKDFQIDTDNYMNFYGYLWNKFYKSNYYVIYPELLDRPIFTQLKNKMGNYLPIKLNDFLLLNQTQKEIVLSILGLEITYVNNLIRNLNKKIFLFTGTTIFNLNERSHLTLINLHKAFIDKYLDKESPSFIGEDYQLFVKLHPFAFRINAKLKEDYPNILFLPEKVPLEILFMLGFVPNKIGGFGSTVYFNLPYIDIDEVMFITKNENAQKGYFEEQYLLMKAMLDLNILSEEKVSYAL